MSHKQPTDPAADDGEYRPVLDPDIAAGTAPKPDTEPAPSSSKPVSETVHREAVHSDSVHSDTAHSEAAATEVAGAPATTASPLPAAATTPTPAEVRYVKKEPSPIARWFLRNLFSLLVVVIVAIFVVSNLATPSYENNPPAGSLTLRFILLNVSGATWMFLTITFALGFLAGVFFLRRHKVREKTKKK